MLQPELKAEFSYLPQINAIMLSTNEALFLRNRTFISSLKKRSGLSKITRNSDHTIVVRFPRFDWLTPDRMQEQIARSFWYLIEEREAAQEAAAFANMEMNF